MLPKFLFVLIHTICNHSAFTAPNPPPTPEEREKYKRTEGQEEHGVVTILRAGNIMKGSIYLLNVAEAVAILALPSAQGCTSDTSMGETALTARLTTHFACAGAHLTVGWVFVVGFSMMAGGTLLRAAAYRQMGRHFTYQLALVKDHKLVTDGPYAVVRHPGYTGALLFVSGSALCQLGPGSYWTATNMWNGVFGRIWGSMYLGMILFLLMGAFIRCAREDAMMREAFGREWEEWARATEYRLFPYVY